MRYGPDDRFWVVTDPTPQSTLDDILFETTLRGLERQFRGGLSMESSPTIFSERQAAEQEARGRLLAMRAS